MSLLSPYRPNLFNVGRWLLKSRPRYICTLCNTHRRLITTANNLAISQPTRESSTQSDQDVLHAPPYVKATSSTQDATAAGHAQAPHHSSQSVGLKGVNRSQGVLKVMVDDELREFDHKFLRDACSCPRCVDPSTKQKRFQTADIPSDCKPKSTHRSEAGTVRIVWRNDIHGYGKEHMSEFTPEFFQSYVSEGRRLRARHSAQPQLTWNQKVMKEKIKWVNYEAFMNEEKDLLEALEQLSAYGLVFLRGVPDSEHEVESIGTRIGSLRDTFYGRTWDVKSVPNAKNVAYTHQYLGLHMDLLYMAQPPGLQLLHCLRSSCTGGSSIFSDAFRAALSLEGHDSKSLSTFPVTYHYRNAGHHYHFTRPTVEWQVNSNKSLRRIANVNWSPPFQAPFDAAWIGSRDTGEAFSSYLKAAKAFSVATEAPESLFELRLEPGQCVIFNNRRVLHARRAFDVKSGERWLKGAYVDSDAFLSKLRVLREACGADPGLDETKKHKV